LCGPILGIASSESCAGAELVGRASFLSLSTIQTTVLGVILAQADQLKRGISTAGKFDFAFRLRGHAVAGCGTIPPSTNSSQHVAVAGRAAALQNQGTMHAAIGTDDEAYLYFESRFAWNQQRIGRGQRFGGLRIFAARTRARMRNVAELGSAGGSLENLMFALG
jgi:hypothetical protein